MDHRFKCKTSNISFLEENIGENFYDLILSKDIYIYHRKQHTLKYKLIHQNEKLLSKTVLRKLKDKPQTYRKQ